MKLLEDGTTDKYEILIKQLKGLKFVKNEKFSL
jgi:hypothetical protein